MRAGGPCRGAAPINFVSYQSKVPLLIHLDQALAPQEMETARYRRERTVYECLWHTIKSISRSLRLTWTAYKNSNTGQSLRGEPPAVRRTFFAVCQRGSEACRTWSCERNATLRFAILGLSSNQSVLHIELARALDFPRFSHQFDLILQWSDQTVTSTNKHLQTCLMGWGDRTEKPTCIHWIHCDGIWQKYIEMQAFKKQSWRLHLQLTLFAFPSDTSFVELPAHLQYNRIRGLQLRCSTYLDWSEWTNGHSFRHLPCFVIFPRGVSHMAQNSVSKRFRSSILESIVLSTGEFTPSAKAPLEVPSLWQLGLCHVVPLCKSWQQKYSAPRFIGCSSQCSVSSKPYFSLIQPQFPGQLP